MTVPSPVSGSLVETAVDPAAVPVPDTLVTNLDVLLGAMSTRATIEQATGVLMELLVCPADDALRVLVAESHRSDRDVRAMASDYLAASGAPAPVAPLITMPAAGRMAAHVLLDAVKVDYYLATDVGTAAINMVLEQVNAIDGAVRVSVAQPAENIEIEVDWSNVAGATVVLLRWFADRLAAVTARDVHAVANEARAFIDGLAQFEPSPKG